MPFNLLILTMLALEAVTAVSATEQTFFSLTADFKGWRQAGLTSIIPYRTSNNEWGLMAVAKEDIPTIANQFTWDGTEPYNSLNVKYFWPESTKANGINPIRPRGTFNFGVSHSLATPGKLVEVLGTNYDATTLSTSDSTQPPRGQGDGSAQWHVSEGQVTLGFQGAENGSFYGCMKGKPEPSGDTSEFWPLITIKWGSPLPGGVLTKPGEECQSVELKDQVLTSSVPNGWKIEPNFEAGYSPWPLNWPCYVDGEIYLCSVVDPHPKPNGM